MKKLLITMLACCICLLALGQNENTNLNKKIDEVAISPPAFTGIDNYINLTAPDANNLHNYLVTNIKYPDKAVSCANEGTEVIKFKVNALGKVTNIDIVNGICPVINEEIVRVLESTNGKWKPGIRDGIPVSMEQEVSIVFSIEENAEKAHEKFLAISENCFKKGAKSFYANGKSKKAERLFTHGIKYMPYDQSLLLMRGLARYERGNIEGAQEDWTRLFELGTLDMNAEFFARVEGLESYKAFLAMKEENR
ncbi:energy transducer TonB [Draconibacterium sp. IB214405]|uniref:energy transducer TonB n=1 Tax=Draconibacterium sp. IB214405 TaxID=3097352 RepID=UPI002A127974|nr:energy transducer TonB [Draconibacterium sp. IB214405]MDX8340488.1 energy transducer TonB [Draconibacterium sp. IB214405]